VELSAQRGLACLKYCRVLSNMGRVLKRCPRPSSTMGLPRRMGLALSSPVPEMDDPIGLLCSTSGSPGLSSMGLLLSSPGLAGLEGLLSSSEVGRVVQMGGRRSMSLLLVPSKLAVSRGLLPEKPAMEPEPEMDDPEMEQATRMASDEDDVDAACSLKMESTLRMMEEPEVQELMGLVSSPGLLASSSVLSMMSRSTGLRMGLSTNRVRLWMCRALQLSKTVGCGRGSAAAGDHHQ
jgi:hypothetical protein